MVLKALLWRLRMYEDHIKIDFREVLRLERPLIVSNSWFQYSHSISSDSVNSPQQLGRFSSCSCQNCVQGYCHVFPSFQICSGIETSPLALQWYAGKVIQKLQTKMKDFIYCDCKKQFLQLTATKVQFNFSWAFVTRWTRWMEATIKKWLRVTNFEFQPTNCLYWWSLLQFSLVLPCEHQHNTLCRPNPFPLKSFSNLYHPIQINLLFLPFTKPDRLFFIYLSFKIFDNYKNKGLRSSESFQTCL